MKTFSYTAHSKQVLGDMHTPVSIYLKVRDMYPQSALMESSDYHAGENITIHFDMTKCHFLDAETEIAIR